jgi:phosphodiesterase/alkaline phosphatase D-like protein
MSMTGGLTMKALKRLLMLLLALAIFAGVMLFAPFASAGNAIKDITLQPGTSESAMNFCWQSSSGGAPVVQLAEYDAASSRFPPDAQSFTGTSASSTKGYYANNVVVTGLTPQTEYIYRVGNGTVYSSVFSFKTGSGSHYSALFVSDAQIGASGSVSADKAAWEKTLSAALGKFPETGFILSAGDQVDYYLESEYDAFLSSPLLLETTKT